MTTTDALDRARDSFARHAWAEAHARLALPQVEGPRPLPVRVLNAYARRVGVAAARDPVVAERFLRVAALQDPPQRLFRPSTARRVLLANLRRRPAPAVRRPEIA
jgi:hypothetical protein